MQQNLATVEGRDAIRSTHWEDTHPMDPFDVEGGLLDEVRPSNLFDLDQS
jgi:hypothetical protein